MHTGLLALQGKDELGKYLRSNLKKLGVSTEFIKGERFFLFFFLRSCIVLYFVLWKGLAGLSLVTGWIKPVVNHSRTKGVFCTHINIQLIVSPL